jgi:Zn-dependent protease
LFERAVRFLPPLLLSLSFHEWAHAWSAWKLGDDTAERMGRLTLNPLAHADPIGTFLFPLLGVPFGWAKPVPVNPARFRRGVNMSRGMMLTAAAGPISNLVLATICALVFGLGVRFAPAVVAPGGGFVEFLVMMMHINVVLAIFNLIPVPPLDGSRIVEGFLPYRFRDGWERFSRIAPFVLIALLFLPGSPLSRLIAGPRSYVFAFLDWVVGTVGAIT